MEKKKVKEIKKNVDILLGSVETHECDPLQDCEECHGRGNCQKCGGQGEVDCDDCHGSGDCHHCHGHGKDTCHDCHGQGSTRCNNCGGSGTCRKCGGSGQIRCKKCGGQGTVKVRRSWESEYHYDTCTECRGTGYVKCPDCSGFFGGGTGKCKKCNGSGQLECKKCHGSGEIICKQCSGSGKCTKCNGSGKLTCKHCSGSGKCPNCSGTGKVTCKRCKGSGWYQTFIKCETTLYAKNWTYVSENPIKEAISSSTGKTIFEGIYMKWKAANQLEFDKTAEAIKTCKDFMGESSNTVDGYVSAYEANNELRTPVRSNDKPYSRSLTAQAIPMTKIEYTTNGQNYVLYVSGDNHVVSYDQVPTEIKAYSQTTFERIKLALTERVRMQQFAMLAAYIFQCDGKTKEESRLLTLIINELNLSDSSRTKFTEKLNSFNSSMPYEELRKHIKLLFSTKKTLSFAWQCMAVDKQVSEEEKNLYNRLASEYNIAEAEKEKLKSYACRFAKIKDENIIAEYCDKTDQSKKIRTIAYRVIAVALAILAISVGCVIFSILSPENPESKEIISNNTKPLIEEKSSGKERSDTNIDELSDKSIEEQLKDEFSKISSDMEKELENSTANIELDASTLVDFGKRLQHNPHNAEEILKPLGFKKSSSDDINQLWTRNCTYDNEKVNLQSDKKKCCIFYVSRSHFTTKITVFDKGLFREMKNSIEYIGYNVTDNSNSSSGNSFITYKHSNSNYPIVIVSDESSDSDLPYNIMFDRDRER